MERKIAIIIAFRDFRDEEYFIPKEILENKGNKIVTVSDSSGLAIGADGGEAEVNLELKDLKTSDFDAILFIGGPGALKHLDKEISYKIVRDSVAQNKVLGAICVASVILAKAGALKGRKATVWSFASDKSAIKILKENGAIFEDAPVVVDGKIITSPGPSFVKNFAEAIISALTRL